MITTLKDDERFWSKVDKHGPMPSAQSIAVHPEIAEEPCWVWTAGKTRYGMFWISPNNRGAHRVALFLTHGVWPTFCLHKCDRELCVRPSHLINGTPAENSKDMVAKGRCNPPSQFGESNNNSKLTEADVRNIREAIAHGYGIRPLARLLGLNRKTIQAIVRRETWGQVL